MTNRITIIRECLVTEKKLFRFVVFLAISSLVGLLLLSALTLFDYQMSIWGLWYLGLFTSIGLAVTLFLAAILGCMACWMRDTNGNQTKSS